MDQIPNRSPIVVMPCGPDCRKAQPLAGTGDWVWCERKGMPRHTGNGASECSAFTPRGAETPPLTPLVW